MDLGTILTFISTLAIIAVGAIVIFRKKNEYGDSVPADYEEIKRKLTDYDDIRQKLAGAEATIDARREEISKLEEAKSTRISELGGRIDELTNKNTALVASISRLNAELDASKEKLRTQEDDHKKMREHVKNEFEKLANDILNEKSKGFSESSKTTLDTIINPLKDQIKEFREKIEMAQKESKEGTGKLEGLVEALAKQSNTMSEEAKNLTLALRGDKKAQGDWGEYILRNLLEESGLREREQFTFQETFTSEDGTSMRTDVIVKMPNSRFLVIDSKVSLNAYVDYVGADDKISRDAALKRLLIDVRNNVARLSEAGYNRLPNRNTPDFVVMFVPNEPALFTALQSDSRLWQDAYKQNILLVGPTTLLSIIRIVNMLWVEERQEQNVEAVMDRGAKMLDKFNNFIDDMQKIDNSLKKARECYDAAYGKLESGPGNLISQAVKLQQLGVRPKKSTLARFGETGVIMADTIEDADIEMADFVLEDKAENDSHSSAN